MADQELDDLTAASSVADADRLYVVQGTVGAGSDRRATRAQLVAGLATTAALTAHIDDTSAAHAASAVSFSPTGTVAATDVQAAIAEVASEAADASNLTTGTLAAARIADGSLPNAKLTTNPLARANHTGTQAANTITGLATVATSGSAADLTGTLAAARIADGSLPTAKLATDPLARANHTGTQLASTISDFAEAVDDEVNSVIVAGSGITKTYDDNANTLTIAADGEFIRDTIGTALVAGTNVTITVNDPGDTITIAASGGGGGGAAYFGPSFRFTGNV